MARKPRIEFAGAIYHLIGRGNYRKPIFEEAGAAQAFERAIGETSERCGWLVHAYVLMNNHYHIVAETPKGNLVEGMHWLQGVYANRFNRFRAEIGHVFQGRYKALLVEPDVSLVRVVDYVHLNPVRAGLIDVAPLQNYAHSSLKRHMGRARPPWLRRDLWLELLDFPDNSRGMRRYLKHLAGCELGDPTQADAHRKEFCRGWVIGTRDYREAMATEFSRMQLARDWGGPELHELNEQQWEQVVRDQLKRLHKTERDLREDRKSAPWKRAIAVGLRTTTGASNPWIARRLNTGHPSYISKWLKETPKF